MNSQRGTVSGSEIIGLGHFQPGEVVTNEDLTATLDTNDEWIRQRTGIATRTIARGVSVAELSIGAARAALEDAGVRPAEVDLIVVATTTATDRCPSTAGRVSAELGCGSPAVFDLNAACSGFAHATAVADQAIRAGAATTAIVIGAEKLSDYTDWTDRTSAVLVADGAGAIVLRASDVEGVSPVTWGSVEGMANSVRIEAPTMKFAQEGKEVFKWGISKAADIARETVKRAGYELSDLHAFIPHQANLRIIEPLARQLGLEKIIVGQDVIDSGNTSAASIPLALSKLWHSGTIEPDQPILLFGFGGGFAYAGQVVRSPRTRSSAAS